MTGTPGQIREELRRAVAACTRHAARFRLGRTNDPQRRAADYPEYDELITVYRTTSDAYADDVEVDLAGFFGAASDNATGGGGGPMGDPPHFVYVAVAH